MSNLRFKIGEEVVIRGKIVEIDEALKRLVEAGEKALEGKK